MSNYLDDDCKLNDINFVKVKLRIYIQDKIYLLFEVYLPYDHFMMSICGSDSLESMNCLMEGLGFLRDPFFLQSKLF